MFTKEQKEGLQERIRQFAKSLTYKQCCALYFRLDDILQFGQGTAELMYAEVHEVMKAKEVETWGTRKIGGIKMADHQISLCDGHEAIQENIEMGVFPDGGVFDADSAYRRGLITLADKEASIEAYKSGGRPVWKGE